MPKVFISGSRSITQLGVEVEDLINYLIRNNYEFVIGDAYGVDALVQSHLLSMGVTKVTIYCSGEEFRNNFGKWPVQHVKTNHPKGSREFYTAKDICMAEVADIGLMIWDAKSIGTLNNIIELTALGKMSIVYINKHRLFKFISRIEDIKPIIKYMPETFMKCLTEKNNGNKKHN